MTGDPAARHPRPDGTAAPSGSDEVQGDRRRQARPSRRTVLATSIGALAGAAAGIGGTVAVAGRAAPAGAPSAGGRSGGDDPPPAAAAVATGRTQAGIDRPTTPQPFALFAVGTAADPHDLGFLAALGRRINALTTDPPPALLPDGPRGLTVTVGIGPRMVRPLGAELPGAEELPVFAGDEHIDTSARGGDVLIACCADDPSILPVVAADLARHVPGWSRRWSQFGYRGPGAGTVARNPLGFLDGISVPHTPAEFDENVWIPRRLGGATICVLRRFRLQVEAFAELPADRREQIIGRRLDGSPLSGGGPNAEINVNAKRPDGTYLIPPHAHVRVANPMLTGSRHMLRRSYSYDNGPGDVGLLFTCYQQDLRTFVVTQRQLDESDSLMRYATPTASATFLILPGFTAAKPLGQGLAAP